MCNDRKMTVFKSFIKTKMHIIFLSIEYLHFSLLILLD